MFLNYDDGTKSYPVLKRFLEIPKIKNVLSSSVVFKTPYFANEQERIDVLIEEPRSFAIIIENKIKGATDQHEQLERYIESVKKHDVPFDNIYAIYLTDNGEKIAGECSLTEKSKKILNYNDESDMGRFIPLNYRYDILPWLEKDVLPNCVPEEDLLISALKQYINHLKCMFGIIENEEQKILIMERLKEELDINGEDIVALDKYLKTIEELECLKNRVVEQKNGLVENWVEEHIKKPFGEYLEAKDSVYSLEVRFDSFERFDIAVHSKEWEKFYFLVQKMGGMYYGIYNKEKSNPYKVKDGTFSGYTTVPWWPAYKTDYSPAQSGESDFWKQVQNRTFVNHLKDMFEEVFENIKMQ